MKSLDKPLERHLYWLDKDDFLWAKDWLRDQGYKLAAARLTPCQVMRATEGRVYYAAPEVWSFLCHRQGSWYRKSERNGHYMMMSEDRLPTEIDGEEVPYSVTNNDGVCSSCAEFFNIISPDSRKLVRSCPGSATFGKAPKEVYVDVTPVKGLNK